MYRFSVLAGSVSTDQQAKKEKETDRDLSLAYIDQETVTLILLPVASYEVNA